MSELLVLTSDR